MKVILLLFEARNYRLFQQFQVELAYHYPVFVVSTTYPKSSYLLATALNPASATFES
jgi:hypothetical protein